jgi:hypothetical protein
MRLLPIILVLATGCVGSVGDEDGGGDGSGSGSGSGMGQRAKAAFKNDVHPVILKCSGGVCHDTTATSAALSKFYNADQEVSYNASVTSASLIGTFSAAAPIITHIEAGHKGLSWSPDEKTKITGWLAKETQERMDGGGGSNTPPVFDAKAALKTFSGCVKLADFTASGMTAGWANLAGDNQAKCLNCHLGGVAGFLISNNNQQFFDGMTSYTGFFQKYFTVDGTAKTVVVNKGSFIAANMIVTPTGNHPTFPVETNAGMVALKKLYDLAKAHQTAGTCDPARLKD